MSLAVGARLGAYEIVAPIGAGGMGEVYRARDTKLHRDVALKVLPDSFATDADRLARFKREAQVLASLNHPNIAGIYGFEESSGISALVLELVEGPTLADRIAQGPIPLDEALPIARQIADALEAAHEHGIIHRDLKPANIKVRDDGTVKVLDFGLAKALSPAEAGHYDNAGAMSQSPTITSPAATRMGMIMGTAAYMSPEQARGKPIDKRSDIWAFGCVLYEMLTGKRAFGGEDVADTLAFILTKEPDWSILPTGTPQAVPRLLRHALEKDRKKRLADIADARIEIDEALATPSELRAGAAGRPKGWERFASIVVAVLVLVCIGLAAMIYFRREAVDMPAFRASIAAPDDATFVYPGNSPAAFMALSPDGRRLALVAAGANGQRRLWVRLLDTGTAQPLTGTDGAAYPFWSPDSRFLAFLADGKLKKIDASGGPAVALSDAPSSSTGGTWNRDNVILFRPEGNGPLHRVSASGGASVPVTTLDGKRGETAHGFPFFLPDGKHFLYYTATGNTVSRDLLGSHVGSLDSTEHKLVLNSGTNVQYSGGYLLFLRDATLMAQPFDIERLELGGDAVPVAEQVSRGGASSQSGAFSVSESGVLAYRTGSSEVLCQLIWFDRTGRQSSVIGEQGDYIDLELSPDRSRAAVSALDPARRTRDIWLFDVARGLRTTRLTFDPASDQAPVWSPDGTRVVFLSGRRGSDSDMFAKAASGLGAEELLWRGGNPRSWSPDGQFILYNTSGAQVGDLWALPTAGDRKPFAFVNTPFTEVFGQFSPDGRWIAYHSNESGRNEIYVASFPEPDGKWLISTGGGTYARWRRDGKEIFYLGPDNKLVSAAVNTKGSTFEVGAVTPLFQTNPRVAGYPYDVSADGQRFLVNMLVDEGGAASRAGPSAAGRDPITLVVNWPALLRP